MLHQSGSILCLAAEYIGIAFPKAHLDGFASRIRGELALQRTGIRNPAPDLLLERCIPDHPLTGTVQAGLFSARSVPCPRSVPHLPLPVQPAAQESLRPLMCSVRRRPGTEPRPWQCNPHRFPGRAGSGVHRRPCCTPAGSPPAGHRWEWPDHWESRSAAMPRIPPPSARRRRQPFRPQWHSGPLH